jgi:hypothetical protein
MHSTFDVKDDYLGSGSYLWNSIKKYGIENHTRDILEFLPTREALKNREREIVNEKFLDNPLCMNLRLGGEGGWTGEDLKKSHQKQRWLSENDPEWKQRKSEKVSKSNAEQFENGIRTFVPSWIGKSPSQSHKDSIGKANSVSQKGEKNSQFGKVWITKENESVRVDKKDIETFLQNGWRKGRKTKFRH